LENVVYDEAHHHVDFNNASITQNTRGAYPIEYMRSAKVPCMAGHPSDVIFLTCDAFGVLPPVSRLTREQAMYHFVNGYTAKVAGTEMGVNEPVATFSPCFGGPFLVWHPNKYAELLAAKVDQHNSRVWLVNTGWTGGPAGVGSRMKLSDTRAIVDAIHSGAISSAPTVIDPVFGLHVVTQCPGVSPQVLIPRQTWQDPAAWDDLATSLHRQFEDNHARLQRGEAVGSTEG
jgi:phosphoenolpyruvate carboxykinase (ATP)